MIYFIYFILKIPDLIKECNLIINFYIENEIVKFYHSKLKVCFGSSNEKGKTCINFSANEFEIVKAKKGIVPISIKKKKHYWFF